MNFKSVVIALRREWTRWKKSFEETVYKYQEKEIKNSSVGDWENA